MKKLILSLLFLVLALNTVAQTDCEYSSNVTDSLGTYKSTKEYLMHERVFGNSKTSIYFSLINADGLLSLNVQLISKSTDFIAARCFDKNSKIYIQLTNGKIITLIAPETETCGNAVMNEKENIRVLNGYFLFSKNNFDELKNATISFIRIKFSGETIDYITKSALTSEIDKNTYFPENYFIKYLKCVQ
ncbi:hypothetical protein [Flavobacterium sp.]|uniref:hypothetical protein n=1 Tax=Flavobacterium sp. TaxID=239 RepID=UPI0026183AAD|nr:hypothetical protein [Flavobacterium sp.]